MLSFQLEGNVERENMCMRRVLDLMDPMGASRSNLMYFNQNMFQFRISILNKVFANVEIEHFTSETFVSEPIHLWILEDLQGIEILGSWSTELHFPPVHLTFQFLLSQSIISQKLVINFSKIWKKFCELMLKIGN